MDWIRQQWSTILSRSKHMTAAERTVILMGVALLLITGYLFVLYAGRAETVSIGGFSDGQSELIVAKLNNRGIEATREGNQVVVPVNQQDEAIIMLVEQDLLSEDTAEAFTRLVEQASPWESRDSSQRAYIIAKQQVLARIIRKMRDVQSADVVISTPHKTGFAATHVRPTASVTIRMQGNGNVNKALVEAVAGLVASGAAAEMTPQDVVVIDANHGRRHTVQDADEVVPTEQRELVRALEDDYQGKIMEVLSFVPNVIVAVNVQTDPIHREVEKQWGYEPNEPLQSEERKQLVRETRTNGGEPGIGPNTGMDIRGSSRQGTTEQLTESRSTFGEKPMIRETHRTMTGHNVEHVAVTVNVPRSYFLTLWQARNPANPQPPDQAAIDAIAPPELDKIVKMVKPLIRSESEGEVSVNMVYDQALLLPQATEMNQASPVLVAWMGSGWTGPAAATGLALVALFLMLMMVRKATKPETLPSVEQLAGIPPSLPSEEDLVGDAMQDEDEMEGYELDPNELESRKVAKQISDLIKTNPREAGHILNKWVHEDDY